MKVELSIEDKLELAKIFKIHRNHLGCTQKEYIQDRQGIPVCSISTYSRLENGIPIKCDEIYEILLSMRMHKTFNYRFDIRVRMKKDFHLLYQMIEAYNLPEAKTVLYQIMAELKKQGDFIMNACYLAVLTQIEAYYFQQKPLQLALIDWDILSIFDRYTQEILIDLLFKDVLRSKKSMREVNVYAEKLEISKSKTSLNYLNRVLLHYYNDEMLSAFLELKTLIRYFDTHALFNRRLDAYDITLSLYVNVQPQNIPDLLLEYHRFVQEHKAQLHPKKLRQSLYNQAMIFLEMQEEAEALKRLSQITDRDDDLTLRKTVISCYLSSHMDLPAAPLNDLKFSSVSNPGALALFTFYQHKQAGASFAELEMLVQEQILSSIDPDDEILMEILKEEIMKLAKSSHETYLLQRFQRLRDHHRFEKNSEN
ncbi:hypothetical protein GSF08_11070 [Clostridiaceae bacterium DONG20-135]|uniref:Uncharacterized protein n=1 Tax=Copranaerobaculum intestinale TaxID=2692629 RepID=A0A6N8UH12_9FIRM|nr:hypothetical protein [Copranaerobaculum intestinale]MXQ74467.1 hypothetical protein [Copranaerobaculum intestinale]